MIRRFVELTAISLLLHLVCALPTEGLENEKHTDSCLIQFRYAKHLMADMDYYRAISEYKRYLFLCPNTSEINEARYNIGLSYFLAGRYKEVIDWNEEMVSRNYSENRLLILTGKSNYRLENSSIAFDLFSEILNDNPDLSEYNQACYYSGLSLVQVERFTEAAGYFHRVEANSPYYQNSQTYIDYLSIGQFYDSKKPNIAGMLSIIPGAGYLYTSHYHTAAASFIVNGLLFWASYNAFQNDRTAEGIIFSTFFVGFYVGNIYGSVQSAHRYNDYHRDLFHSQFAE